LPDSTTPDTPDTPDAPPPTTRRIPSVSIQTAKARIVDALADLAPYTQSVDEERRKHMRRISHRDSDSIHRAEAIARANPKFRPGFLVMDEFTASLDNTDGLEDLRDQLTVLLARVNDTIQVESTAAADSASAVYKVIQVAARLKDRDAQAAEADLASRMIKRGRSRTAKGSDGGATAGAATA
jgi:hypothetical protein